MEYTYECILPAEPVLPERIDVMSQTTEMSAHEYLHCFCVGSAASLPRDGHRFSSKLGSLTFVVPTGQLMIRAAMTKPDPAAARPANADDCETVDDDDVGEAPVHVQPLKRSRASAPSARKRAGYAKATLNNVDKLLHTFSPMTWGRETTEEFYKTVNSKM